MPLHRYNLAHPQHLNTVPTGTFHSTYLYMCTIGVPMMDGVSQKSTVTEKTYKYTTNGTERIRNPTSCVDAYSVLVHLTSLSNEKGSMRKLDPINHETEA
jgi:hypothetical protein